MYSFFSNLCFVDWSIFERINSNLGVLFALRSFFSWVSRLQYLMILLWDAHGGLEGWCSLAERISWWAHCKVMNWGLSVSQQKEPCSEGVLGGGGMSCLKPGPWHCESQEGQLTVDSASYDLVSFSVTWPSAQPISSLVQFLQKLVLSLRIRLLCILSRCFNQQPYFESHVSLLSFPDPWHRLLASLATPSACS